MKTSELTGTALDWVVAKCDEGHDCYITTYGPLFGSGETGIAIVGKGRWRPSTYWAQGGPLIEREGISIIRCEDYHGMDSKGFCNNVRIPVWGATNGQQGTFTFLEGEHYDPQYEIPQQDVIYGPTPLIAAMRCYVASKLGDEVDVPEELL